MNNERVIAGIFTGAGSLLAIYLGTITPDPILTTGGLVILSSLMAFFVGEKNGSKNKTA